LDLSGNPINDLEPLRPLENLASLDISDTSILNLSPLLDLKGLVDLAVSRSIMSNSVFAKLKEVIEDRGGSITVGED
jgi:Leucine-rich repeat (LRR) protein